MNKLEAFLSISRAKLLVASMGHATLGMLLAAPTLDEFLSYRALLFVLLLYSIVILACNINSLTDYEVDRHYKTYMSQGVDVLGKGAIRALIALETAVALLLTFYFLMSGFLITAFLAFLGIFIAFAYSVNPIRFKGRGLVSPLPILLGFYTLPLIAGWFLFSNELSLLFILFVIGYALMNEGFTLVNTCEDYSEDRAEGVRTWAHIFGLRRTLALAHGMAFSGLLCPVAMILLATSERLIDGPESLLFFLAAAMSALLILKAAGEVGESRRGHDPERSAKLYGKRLPKWFLMTRYPLVLTALVMLL